MTKAVEKLTEAFQKDCHETVNEVLKIAPKCSVQDATNVWLFNKLAGMQDELNKLRKQTNNY